MRDLQSIHLKKNFILLSFDSLEPHLFESIRQLDVPLFLLQQQQLLDCHLRSFLLQILLLLALSSDELLESFSLVPARSLGHLEINLCVIVASDQVVVTDPRQTVVKIVQACGSRRTFLCVLVRTQL